MEPDAKKPVLLNIGCGRMILGGYINVDAYGDPDVKWDLNIIPWPFEDNSVDGILAAHIFEHLTNWWGAFGECARILKPGGQLNFRVPHISSSTATGYRDHINVFGPESFHGIEGTTSGTNTWAESENNSVPMKILYQELVVFKQYRWMQRFPKLVIFLANHFRNFVWEHGFIFIKTR